MVKASYRLPMRVGFVLPMGDEVRPGVPVTGPDIFAMARDIEAAGFDSLWIFDHLQAVEGDATEPTGSWEPWTLLAGLAAVTERAQLGTIVTCTSFRPPALLARMAHSVHEISGGRLILGLGAGWHEPEYIAFGYPFDHRYSRFVEALTIIRGMLTAGASTFAGRFYHTNDARLLPPPTQPAPPILIGTHGPKMLALTAEYAQAYNTAWHALPGPRWAKARAAMQAACAGQGRDPATLTTTVGVLVRSDDSADDAFGLPCDASALADAFSAWAAEGVDDLILLLDPPSRRRAQTAVEALNLYRAASGSVPVEA
jgi:alkanesulfonate monooxygenase SsuD/methylene tetrahydromethanopterin reductase-like flavin-dependent oxidoreductase (luciferase family)